MDESIQTTLMELIERMNGYFDQPEGEEIEEQSEIIPNISVFFYYYFIIILIVSF